uniref:Bcl-2 Bcl-2 homology region 1-3 domain-containing protein n=1 Tax=Oreochromis niloticus TaxID=8128 RepID=A0A669F4C0_ORENI
MRCLRFGSAQLCGRRHLCGRAHLFHIQPRQALSVYRREIRQRRDTLRTRTATFPERTTRLTESRTHTTECTLKTCNCNNHTHVHTGMLSLQTTAAEVPMVTGVARALFSDGIINWGRVVSLVAYGTVLLRASKSTLGPECAYEIGVSIAAYITDNHMDWLVGSDGWSACWFCTSAPPEFVHFCRLPLFLIPSLAAIRIT